LTIFIINFRKKAEFLKTIKRLIGMSQESKDKKFVETLEALKRNLPPECKQAIERCIETCSDEKQKK